MRSYGSILILSLIVVAAMAAASLYGWSMLPADEKVPVSWNGKGEPSRFAEPWLALGVLPALALLVTLIFAIIPAVEPREKNLAKSSFAFRFIWGTMISFLMIIHLAYIWALLSGGFAFPAVTGVIVGLLFMALGFVMPGVKSNFFIGVRTPWTLSSETVWAKTHRVAGPVLFLYGFAVAAAALFGTRRLYFQVLIVGALAMAALLVLYSLVLWVREGRKTE